MKDYESLHEALCDYFDINDPYVYNLTRVKSAFAEGTMGFEDFEEWTEDDVAEIVEVIKKWEEEENKQAHWIDVGCKCSNCGQFAMDTYDYCPFCGAKMRKEDA